MVPYYWIPITWFESIILIHIWFEHVIDRNYDINITVPEGGSMKKSFQIDDFWKKYLDAVLKRSVPKGKAEWYLKWPQNFAVSTPGPT
jgi:hypothetical protein